MGFLMSDAPPVAATTGSDRHKNTKMINLDKIVFDIRYKLTNYLLHICSCRDRTTATASVIPELYYVASLLTYALRPFPFPCYRFLILSLHYIQKETGSRPTLHHSLVRKTLLRFRLQNYYIIMVWQSFHANAILSSGNDFQSLRRQSNPDFSSSDK